MRVNPKNSNFKEKYFFLFILFSIFMRKWVFTKLVVNDIGKSNHYVRNLKLIQCYMSIISIKL